MNGHTLKPLSGGLMTAVIQMQNSPKDLLYFGAALRRVLEHEARAHDANNGHFGKILEAVKQNKIQAWFIVAGWENCLPKVIGAAIEFPTVLTKWDGQDFRHYPAVYGEDTCLLPHKLKELIREKPKGMSFPKDMGLGAYFNQERMRLMAEHGYRGRVGEYSAHSRAIIGILNKFGASLDMEQACPVMQIDGLTRDLKDRWKVTVETEELISGNMSMPNVFLTSWASEDGKQRIVASFTEGFSTFTGDTVVRTQVTTNGKLPSQEVLKDVLASLLTAGYEEIANRQWGIIHDSHRSVTRSPIIPIDADRREVLRALRLSSYDEVLGRHLQTNILAPIFGDKELTMRIHAPNEKEVIAALKDTGAQIRMLGPHPMLPGIMDLANTPDGTLNLNAHPARPLRVIQEVSNGLVLSFAA